MAEKNTEVKETTRQFIETLLDSFHIDINYKDDIFLEQSSSYKHLISSNLGSRNKTSPKYNPNHKVLYDEKRKLTFADVKYDFASKGQKDLLKDLEGRYIESKIGDAWVANEDLPNSSMDAIADAVVKFMYEVDDVKRKKRKNVTATCLDKVDKNMCLVYKDGKSTPYQFPSLEKVLEVIAEETVNYCNSLTEIKNKSRGGNKREHVTPLFIRKTCVLVCYTLLDFGNYVSVKTQKKPLSAITGVSKQIMADLHKRCSDLGYPYFTKENKLFQSDKWAMSPDKLLRKDSYVAPLSPISYAGLKQGYLGFMIRELQSQVPHKTFLDAFGGSGISIVQFPHEDGVNYYVNDFDFANICYYHTLKASDEIFGDFLKKLNYTRNIFLDAHNKLEEKEISKQDFDYFIDAFYGLFMEASSICCNDAKVFNLTNIKLKNFKSSVGNYPSLQDGLKRIYGSDFRLPEDIDAICSGNVSYVDIAVVFTIFYQSLMNGRAEPTNRPGSALTNKDFKTLFTAIREAYKDINIVSDVGANALDLLREKFNNEHTLAYLDSPYTGTSKYSANKADKKSRYKKGTVIKAEDYGKDFISNDFDMKDLIQCCKSYDGKFIFSCRANMVSKDVTCVTFTCETCNDYGEVKKNPMPKANYNNYLWFMSQWLDTDYNVLFLVNKERDVTQFYASYIGEGNEECKNRVLSADWGMDISESDKQYIYDFLKFMILNGNDLELMITNFDFKVPDFDNMFEQINNIYEKGNHAVLSQGNHKDGDIPVNGMFCKMPMKLLADIAYTELGRFRDRVEDWKIR